MAPASTPPASPAIEEKTFNPRLIGTVLTHITVSIKLATVKTESDTLYKRVKIRTERGRFSEPSAKAPGVLR
jgi:hypothetical protein